MLHLTVQSRNLTNLKINEIKYENTRGENLGNFVSSIFTEVCRINIRYKTLGQMGRLLCIFDYCLSRVASQIINFPSYDSQEARPRITYD